MRRILQAARKKNLSRRFWDSQSLESRAKFRSEAMVKANQFKSGILERRSGSSLQKSFGVVCAASVPKPSVCAVASP